MCRPDIPWDGGSGRARGWNAFRPTDIDTVGQSAVGGKSITLQTASNPSRSKRETRAERESANHAHRAHWTGEYGLRRTQTLKHPEEIPGRFAFDCKRGPGRFVAEELLSSELMTPNSRPGGHQVGGSGVELFEKGLERNRNTHEEIAFAESLDRGLLEISTGGNIERKRERIPSARDEPRRPRRSLPS